ncbi:MAG: ATP-binding protein, partial [Stellaceae bacterium]
MIIGRLAAPPPHVPAGGGLVAAMRRLLKTHAVRLAALYFAVFAVSVLGVLLFVYWVSANFIERQTEATLDAEVTGLAEQYAQRGLSGLIQIVAARSAGDRGDGMFYLVTDPSGHPLAGNIANWPAGAKFASGSVSFTVEVPVKGRMESHPAQGILFRIPRNYRLLVGRDISDAAAFRDRIKTTLLWSGLVALGVGLIGGSIMGRNMLRRVERVNRTAERVMAGNLSDRVPVMGTSDEFDQLAANLNGMLDQIERLMMAMREVTDNVAHDLKTPLSRLRARLELTLLSPTDETAQGEAIRAAIDEADRLLATFNALLSITEAESGASRSRAEPLDLGELARAAAELYEPVAEEKGFALRLDSAPGIMVRGDRHLLSQAIANLLDNALKYGGGGDRPGEIELSVAAQEGRAALEISDRGPGIPVEDQETVFDRFVRLEPSR